VHLEAQDFTVKALDCTLETGLSTFGGFSSWPYRCEPGNFCGAADDLRVFDQKSGLRAQDKLSMNDQF